METHEAIDIINNNLAYKPDWNIEAYVPFYERDGVNIRVLFRFPSYNSARELFIRDMHKEDGVFENMIGFPLIVDDVETADDLVYKILEHILRIENHEAREFLRLRDDSEYAYRAPFHPHKDETMVNYATRTDNPGRTMVEDILYGQ